MEELFNIAQLGVAGLAVILFYKLLVRQSRHVEVALDKLTDMIERLTRNINNQV